MLLRVSVGALQLCDPAAARLVLVLLSLM